MKNGGMDNEAKVGKPTPHLAASEGEVGEVLKGLMTV